MPHIQHAGPSPFDFERAEWEDEDSITRLRLPDSEATLRKQGRDDESGERLHRSPASEPTLVNAPEPETLVRLPSLPKAAPCLELDERLLGSARSGRQRVVLPLPTAPPRKGVPLPPVAAEGFGFVPHVQSAEVEPLHVEEAPRQPPAARPAPRLRNGLPFVAPPPSGPSAPLYNGLPFVPLASPPSRPLVRGLPFESSEDSGPHAPPDASSSAPLPLSRPAAEPAAELSTSSHGSADALPWWPREGLSQLPVPPPPSARFVRTDLGASASGLPPVLERPRRSLADQIAAAVDLPLWAVALVGTSVVVVTVTVAFALLLDAQSPARTAYVGLPTVTPPVHVVEAPPAPAPGALRITSQQPGLRAEVDGVDRGRLPVSIEQLEPGTHVVRLSAGPRFEPLERKVEVESGRTLHLADVRLLPRDAAAAQRAAAEKAREERRAKLEEARRKAAEREEARRRALEEDKKRKQAEEERRLAEQARAKDEPKPGAVGTININSLPSSKAILDGKAVGNTPVMGLSVPAGPHSVVFVHPKYGKAAVSVQVRAGKTAVAAHRFPYKD